MSDKCKTISIPLSLKEAQESGLISQAAIDALTAERIMYQEKIEGLKKLFEENIISKEQLEASIRGIQKEMQDKIIALNFE